MVTMGRACQWPGLEQGFGAWGAETRVQLFFQRLPVKDGRGEGTLPLPGLEHPGDMEKWALWPTGERWTPNVGAGCCWLEARTAELAVGNAGSPQQMPS